MTRALLLLRCAIVLTALFVATSSTRADTYAMYLGSTDTLISEFQYSGTGPLPAFTITLPGFAPIQMATGGYANPPLTSPSSIFLLEVPTSFFLQVMEAQGDSLGIVTRSIASLGITEGEAVENSFSSEGAGVTFQDLPEPGTGVTLLSGLMLGLWLYRRRQLLDAEFSNPTDNPVP